MRSYGSARLKRFWVFHPDSDVESKFPGLLGLAVLPCFKFFGTMFEEMFCEVRPLFGAHDELSAACRVIAKNKTGFGTLKRSNSGNVDSISYTGPPRRVFGTCDAATTATTHLTCC